MDLDLQRKNSLDALQLLLIQMANVVYGCSELEDWVASPEYALCLNKYQICSKRFYGTIKNEEFFSLQRLDQEILAFENCKDLVLQVSKFYFA